MSMRDFIQIELEGKDNDLPAEVFLSSNKCVLSILRNIDAALTHQSSGTVSWFILSIRKESPATLVLAPKLKRGSKDLDVIDKIPHFFLDGISRLETESTRPTFFADATLKLIRDIGKLYRSRLERFTVSSGDRSVNITSKSVAHIDDLIAESCEAYSSVIGKLESVTIHNGNEFRVWEETTNLPVRCLFEEPIFEKVRESLGKRVIVNGLLKSNSQGNPISIAVENINLYQAEEDLPTIEEISGLVPNLTGNLSLKEYMEALRDA